MSYFNIGNIAKNINNKISDNVIKYTFKAIIGDKIYYDKNLKRFEINKYDIPYLHNINKIPIGIVLDLDEDFNTTILIKSFLTNSPLYIPDTYFGKNSNLITLYVKSIFKRYCNMFIKKCPEIKKIKRMKLYMPSSENMANIVTYKNRILNGILEFSGEEYKKNFLHELITSYIYIYDNKMTKLWKCPNKDKEQILDVDFTPGNFLIITKIKLDK